MENKLPVTQSIVAGASSVYYIHFHSLHLMRGQPPCIYANDLSLLNAETAPIEHTLGVGPLSAH